MILERCGARKRLMANTALEKFLSRVYMHMSLHIAAISKPLVAHLTNMRLLTRMNQLMPLKVTSGGERLLTDITGIHGCSGTTACSTSIRQYTLQITE